MTKLNTILKKAELYERLALYGNRKDFLRSIAQSSTPGQVNENLAEAIRLINGVADALNRTLTTTSFNKYKLDGSADIDQVDNAKKALSRELENAANTTDIDIKTKLVQIRNALANASERISRNRQWAKEQQNIGSKELEPADVLAIPPDEYGEYAAPASITSKKPATDNISFFNFYFKKLEDAYTGNNLNGMFNFVTKLETITNKLDNPYADDATKALVEKGKKLISDVKGKLNM